MRLTAEQMAAIAHHLGVAASRYEDHAGSVALPRVAEQFKLQAGDARALACLFASADSATLHEDEEEPNG